MTQESAPPHPYQDRSAGLIVFGVLTILIGLFCALIIPAMLFGSAQSAASAPAGRGQLLSAAGVYGTLAVALVWLGIGSIMARRWARALLLLGAWTWLLVGVMAMIFLAVLLPQIASAIPSHGPSGPLSDKARLAILLLPAGVIFFLGVVLPGIWVIFYRGSNVRATCEHRDPVTRWTDRCPLPVLAVSLWLAAGALSMVLGALGPGRVVPFFGTFLHGSGGLAALLAVAALWLYAARACYRLQPAGWWIIVVCIGLFAVSHFLTYSQHEIAETYHLMGYGPEQIAQIEKFQFLNSRTFAWMPVLWLVPSLAYLGYVRRYFPKPIRR